MQTDFSKLKGIHPIQQDSDTATGLICRGELTATITKDAGAWGRYVDDAKAAIDLASGTCDPTGIMMFAMAIIHLAASGYYGNCNSCGADEKLSE